MDLDMFLSCNLFVLLNWCFRMWIPKWRQSLIYVERMSISLKLLGTKRRMKCQKVSSFQGLQKVWFLLCSMFSCSGSSLTADAWLNACQIWWNLDCIRKAWTTSGTKMGSIPCNKRLVLGFAETMFGSSLSLSSASLGRLGTDILMPAIHYLVVIEQSGEKISWSFRWLLLSLRYLKCWTLFLEKWGEHIS